MNLNALDLIALDIYKDGLRAAKDKYVTLHEENYNEIAKQAYSEANYFIKYAKISRSSIPQDIETIP